MDSLSLTAVALKFRGVCIRGFGHRFGQIESLDRNSQNGDALDNGAEKVYEHPFSLTCPHWFPFTNHILLSIHFSAKVRILDLYKFLAANIATSALL